MSRRSVDLILAFGIAILFLAVTIRSYVDEQFARKAFAQTSLYCMYLCVGNLCFSIVRLFNEVRVAHLYPASRRGVPWVVASAAAITLTCVSIVGLKFAVLADEAHLISISQSFLRSGQPSVLHQAINLSGELTILEEAVPARPLLFPTLVMPLHLLFGYHFQNGQILNALLFLVLLASVGVIAVRYFSRSQVVALQLLIAAQPLLIWSAMSGGFDQLALLMLMLALAFFWIDSRIRSSASAYCLWSTLLAFSMVRYESPLIAFIIGLVFLITRGRDALSQRGFVTPYMAAAFCIFPVLWLHLIADQALTRDAEGARFSVEYLMIYSSELFVHLFTRLEPFNPIVSVAAMIGITVVAVRWIRSANRFGFLRDSSFMLVLTCSFGLTGLYLSYWAGGIGEAVSGRFFLVFGVGLGIIAFVGIHCLIPPRHVSASVALVVGIAAFGLGLFQVRNDDYYQRSLAPWELQRISEFVDSNPGDGKLYAYHLPVELTMRGESAVRIRTINEEMESFAAMVHQAGVRELIVFQRAHTESGRVHPLMATRPDIALSNLHTYRNGLYEFRISRVTRIGNLHFRPPDES